MSLTDILLAAGGCAVLFVLFTVFRPAKECSGDCTSCVTGGSCPSERGQS
jgi:hypothetical protein